MSSVHEKLKKVNDNDNQPTCEAMFYIGLGEEAQCGKPATYTINTGTAHEYALCCDCIDDVHPSRIKKIEGATC